MIIIGILLLYLLLIAHHTTVSKNITLVYHYAIFKNPLQDSRSPREQRGQQQMRASEPACWRQLYNVLQPKERTWNPQSNEHSTQCQLIAQCQFMAHIGGSYFIIG